MLKSGLITGAVLLGALMLGMLQPALAGAPSYRTIKGPDYGIDGNYRTPAADGRPGVYYFDLGAYAFRKHDYRHAVDMYKVASSWAYKPAEYDLALMYFRGEGVPVDRARGAAWAILAAERGTPLYVKARNAMVTLLTDAQFKRTNEIWNQLKGTYGDKVALRRAERRWMWVGSHETGSHVRGGAVGELRVGSAAPGPPSPSATKGSAGRVDTSGSMLLAGGSVDGSTAYGQFRESDNPYSPIYLKHRQGKVTVEPLQPVKPAAKRGHTQHAGAPQLPAESPQGL